MQSRRNPLEAAFRATTYRVDAGAARFDLRVGNADPAFVAWLAQCGYARWAIMTACNPGGILSAERNPQRSLALHERIKQSGWRHVPAVNCADAPDWPDEPGFCIFDADERVSCELATGFGQAAIVCGSSDDGQVRLVWLQDVVSG